MAGSDESRDFGELLAEFEREQAAAGTGKDPAPGQKASGKVLSIGEEAAFVDLGGKSDGVVSLAELTDEEGELTAEVGDTVEGIVTGRDEASGGLILRVRPDAAAGGGAGTELALDELGRAYEHGTAVEGSVAGAIKGGVEVQVLGLRAFCPVSQLEVGYVEEPEVYVGRRLSFRVTKFHRSGRGGRPDVVVSRRALLEEEAAQRRQETLARLEEGAVVRGVVTSVTGFGAFVDLGGVEGLLHVSEMSHDRVEDPADVVSPGEALEVKVLKMESRGPSPDQELRISLSRRALEQDPWEEAAARFPEGATVPGRVMRMEPYGAFVRLAPGLEGMVHVSELDPGRRVNHPRDVVELGQDVTVRILSVDPERRRIALSLATDGEPTGADARREAAATGSDLDSSGFGSLADAFEKARKKD